MGGIKQKHWWFKHLVGHRSRCLWCGFAGGARQGGHHVLHGLGIAPPGSGDLLEVLPSVCYPASTDPWGSEPWRADEYEHNSQFLDARALPFDPEVSLVVFDDLLWRGGDLRATRQAEPLEVLLAELPRPAPTTETATRPRIELGSGIPSRTRSSRGSLRSGLGVDRRRSTQRWTRWRTRRPRRPP